MRAIFEKKINLQNILDIKIDDERLHHLNVVRTRVKDEVLVFDGIGGCAKFIVENISKKEAELRKVEYNYQEKKLELKLFLGNPKKDAFEDILKIAVECGITEIYPLNTKYSQFEYLPNTRFDRLIESALVQSNNFYWPVIHHELSLENFLNLNLNTDFSILFSSFGKLEGTTNLMNSKNIGIFIGPEAGFHLDEEKMILELFKNVKKVHLPSPILRSPTAVAVSSGYIYAHLEKGN